MSRLSAALVAVWVLVIARSLVFIVYQQSFFDSDQAIVGLMAKHFSEGRAFPLFYYGQTYLLGVDAWIAAVFFLVAGPTVAALHAATAFVNLAIAGVLLVHLVRSCGLRPFEAVAASLFFALAPPFTSLSLIEAGANIATLLFVLLLWHTRDRPLWFGAILAVGTLYREFTMYAVLVLLAGQLIRGGLFRAERIRMWLLAGAMFFAVWQTVDVLKPYADLAGPGSRGWLTSGPAWSEVENVTFRLKIEPAELPARFATMMREYFPRQIGALAIDSATAPQGHDWMFWPLMLALTAALFRGAQLSWKARAALEAGTGPAFGWFLIGVGTVAVTVYAVTRSLSDGLVDRYLLLSLYLPIGIVAVFLSLEPHRAARRAMLALLVFWAGLSIVDHARLLLRYRGGREPDEVQALADGLVARGIHVARADYWRAYRVSFLARERVKVDATGVHRILEYERLARAEGARLLMIQEAPCVSDQPPIGRWYLCRIKP